jgi:predicted outer membrane protein
MSAAALGRRRGRRGRAAAGVTTLVAALLGCGERAEPEAAAPAGAAAAAHHPAGLFARIDSTLAFAIEQGQLAALDATDVALRAFAVQQVARYTQLRRQLQEVAAVLAATPAPPGPPTPASPARGSIARRGERLGTLQVSRGRQFDHAYVRPALLVHQELLADLDAALRLDEDAEVRHALERLRGAVDGGAPDEAGDAAADEATDEATDEAPAR